MPRVLLNPYSIRTLDRWLHPTAIGYVFSASILEVPGQGRRFMWFLYDFSWLLRIYLPLPLFLPPWPPCLNVCLFSLTVDFPRIPSLRLDSTLSPPAGSWWAFNLCSYLYSEESCLRQTLWGCHLKIPNFWTRASAFSFCTGSHKFYNLSCSRLSHLPPRIPLPPVTD